MIKNQRISDDGVDTAIGPGDLRLAHAVANDLAASEFDLFAVGRSVYFDLDNQVCVGQPNFVSHSGAIHIGVGFAINVSWHILLLQRPIDPTIESMNNPIS